MEFRPTKPHELPLINAMFEKIVAKMDSEGVSIWNEYYPFDYFEEDIAAGRQYLLADGDDILAALTLCDEYEGEEHIGWADSGARALYLDRFGVSADHSRKGYGGIALKHAMDTARSLGAKYLRLFVVDRNLPAIRLYEKNGFVRREGFYDEVIDDETTLREYGYEIEL